LKTLHSVTRNRRQYQRRELRKNSFWGRRNWLCEYKIIRIYF